MTTAPAEAQIRCLFCYGREPAGCATCAGTGVLALGPIGGDEPQEAS